MKKIVALMVAVMMVVLLTACGSGYPVSLGSSYQDVYDYCKENSNTSSNNDVNGFEANDLFIHGDLDWFGDGTIYQCSFLVEKASDSGLLSITVEPIIDGGDFDDLDINEQDEIVMKMFEELKSKHGDPIGEANPDAFDIRSSGVTWEDDNMEITLGGWKNDDYKINYTEAD